MNAQQNGNRTDATIMPDCVVVPLDVDVLLRLSGLDLLDGKPRLRFIWKPNLFFGFSLNFSEGTLLCMRGPQPSKWGINLPSA